MRLAHSGDKSMAVKCSADNSLQALSYLLFSSLALLSHICFNVSCKVFQSQTLHCLQNNTLCSYCSIVMTTTHRPTTGGTEPAATISASVRRYTARAITVMIPSCLFFPLLKRSVQEMRNCGHLSCGGVWHWAVTSGGANWCIATDNGIKT